MMANTSPTACSDRTPSRSRAPPECHSPMTGQLSASARAYAARITLQPADPIAPPCTVGSDANATAGPPLIRPTPASIPLSSSAVMVVNDPGSNRAAIRTLGLRGSTVVRAVGRSGAAVTERSGRDGDVVAAEAEGVVQRGERPSEDRAVSARGPPLTTSSRTSSSGSSRLIVGGAVRSCSASTVAIDSTAPAAPSR